MCSTICVGCFNTLMNHFCLPVRITAVMYSTCAMQKWNMQSVYKMIHWYVNSSTLCDARDQIWCSVFFCNEKWNKKAFYILHNNLIDDLYSARRWLRPLTNFKRSVLRSRVKNKLFYSTNRVFFFKILFLKEKRNLKQIRTMFLERSAKITFERKLNTNFLLRTLFDDHMLLV